MGLWLRARPERVARSILGISAALILGVLVLTGLRLALSGVWEPLEAALLERLPEDHERARGLVAAVQNIVTPWSPVLAGQLGVAAALLVTFWAAARAYLTPIAAMRLVTVLLCCDLALFGRGFLETRSTRDLTEMPAVVVSRSGVRWAAGSRCSIAGTGRCGSCSCVCKPSPLLWGSRT